MGESADDSVTFDDVEVRFCPHGHGALERIEGKLALIEAPPVLVAFQNIVDAGTQVTRMLAGHLPVKAFACPKCGLIQLYGDNE